MSMYHHIYIYIVNYFDFVPASSNGIEVEGEGKSQNKCRKTRKYKKVYFVIILYYDKNLDIFTCRHFDTTPNEAICILKYN